MNCANVSHEESRMCLVFLGFPGRGNSSGLMQNLLLSTHSLRMNECLHMCSMQNDFCALTADVFTAFFFTSWICTCCICCDFVSWSSLIRSIWWQRFFSEFFFFTVPAFVIETKEHGTVFLPKVWIRIVVAHQIFAFSLSSPHLLTK